MSKWHCVCHECDRLELLTGSEDIARAAKAAHYDVRGHKVSVEEVDDGR